MFPTSDADFILFESEVRKWVEILKNHVIVLFFVFVFAIFVI